MPIPFQGSHLLGLGLSARLGATERPVTGSSLTRSHDVWFAPFEPAPHQPTPIVGVGALSLILSPAMTKQDSVLWPFWQLSEDDVMDGIAKLPNGTKARVIHEAKLGSPCAGAVFVIVEAIDGPVNRLEDMMSTGSGQVLRERVGRSAKD